MSFHSRLAVREVEKTEAVAGAVEGQWCLR